MTDIIPFTPSQKLIDEFPEIAQITIYGTSEDPLFPLSQVEDVIGSKRIRLDMCGYKLGIDYVKLVCARKDGRMNEQNLLTEQGLYKVLARTDTPVSEKFQTFTKVVMKELRLRGQVTLDTALQQLKAEIEEQKARIAQQDQQLEREHAELMQYKRDCDKFYTQKMAAMERAIVAERRLLDREESTDTPEYQVEKLKAMYMKPIYVYLVKPPKAIKDEFSDFNELEPTEDEEICFEVSFSKRSQPTCMDGLYLHRHIKMSEFELKLHERDFTVTVDGKIRNMFRGTMEDIRSLVASML
jgi:prophage antirepressor-like protein